MTKLRFKRVHPSSVVHVASHVRANWLGWTMCGLVYADSEIEVINDQANCMTCMVIEAQP